MYEVVNELLQYTKSYLVPGESTCLKIVVEKDRENQYCCNLRQFLGWVHFRTPVDTSAEAKEQQEERNVLMRRLRQQERECAAKGEPLPLYFQSMLASDRYRMAQMERHAFKEWAAQTVLKTLDSHFDTFRSSGHFATFVGLHLVQSLMREIPPPSSGMNRSLCPGLNSPIVAVWGNERSSQHSSPLLTTCSSSTDFSKLKNLEYIQLYQQCLNCLQGIIQCVLLRHHDSRQERERLEHETRFFRLFPPSEERKKKSEQRRHILERKDDFLLHTFSLKQILGQRHLEKVDLTSDGNLLRQLLRGKTAPRTQYGDPSVLATDLAVEFLSLLIHNDKRWANQLLSGEVGIAEAHSALEARMHLLLLYQWGSHDASQVLNGVALLVRLKGDQLPQAFLPSSIYCQMRLISSPVRSNRSDQKNINCCNSESQSFWRMGMKNGRMHTKMLLVQDWECGVRLPFLEREIFHHHRSTPKQKEEQRSGKTNEKPPPGICWVIVVQSTIDHFHLKYIEQLNIGVKDGADKDDACPIAVLLLGNVGSNFMRRMSLYFQVMAVGKLGRHSFPKEGSQKEECFFSLAEEVLSKLEHPRGVEISKATTNNDKELVYQQRKSFKTYHKSQAIQRIYREGKGQGNHSSSLTIDDEGERGVLVPAQNEELQQEKSKGEASGFSSTVSTTPFDSVTAEEVHDDPRKKLFEKQIQFATIEGFLLDIHQCGISEEANSFSSGAMNNKKITEVIFSFSHFPDEGAEEDATRKPSDEPSSNVLLNQSEIVYSVLLAAPTTALLEILQHQFCHKIHDVLNLIYGANSSSFHADILPLVPGECYLESQWLCMAEALHSTSNASIRNDIKAEIQNRFGDPDSGGETELIMLVLPMLIHAIQDYILARQMAVSGSYNKALTALGIGQQDRQDSMASFFDGKPTKEEDVNGSSHGYISSTRDYSKVHRYWQGTKGLPSVNQCLVPCPPLHFLKEEMEGKEIGEPSSLPSSILASDVSTWESLEERSSSLLKVVDLARAFMTTRFLSSNEEIGLHLL